MPTTPPPPPPPRRPRERAELLSYGLLRTGFGVMLITHGLPKLIGTSHGSMADPMAGSVNLIANVLQLPAAPLIGWLVALLEGCGGLLLAVGLLTRWIAPLVVVQMIVICWLMGPTFPWIDRGFEYPLMLVLMSLLIAVRGSGPYSLDAWLDTLRNRKCAAAPSAAIPGGTQ